MMKVASRHSDSSENRTFFIVGRLMMIRAYSFQGFSASSLKATQRLPLSRVGQAV
jgi:hypothetical protein